MIKEYTIRGVDCANCARKIEEKINKEKHISKISIDILTDTLIIDSKEQQKIIKKIKSIESSVQIKEKQEENQEEEKIQNVLYQITVGVLLIIISLLVKDEFQMIILLIAYIVIGYKILLKSFKNIIRGNLFDEFFLMGLATVAAILIGNVFEAVMVMLLYTIGEYLQLRAMTRSKQSIQSILEFQVKEVEKINNNQNILIKPSDLVVGDKIKVKVGEKIPVDCILQDDKARLNTSALTGESIPKTFNKGDEVLAGMLVDSKSIILEVKRVYNDSTISKMIKLIKESNKNKSKTEKFITRFAKIYTPIIVLFALSIVIFLPFLGVPLDEAIYRAIILLVISCPCALVISVPLGYFLTIGKNTKQGVLIKGANFIDGLSKIEVLVVDKTGTLTKGNFEVDKVLKYSNQEEKKIFKILYLGEKSSSHPIAKSICDYYEKTYEEKMPGIEIIEVKGQGIVYEYENSNVLVGNIKLLETNNIKINSVRGGGTVVYVAIDDKHVMTIIVKDQLKKDTLEGLNLLKKNKIKDIIMLTGDTKEVAKEVALETNINRFYSDLLPDQKVEKLKEIKKQYTYVGFIGDGINDAASLSLADVGIAMGEIGSDVAIQSADVIINNDSLINLYKAIEISKRGLRIIKANIFLAISIKLLFIVLALFGQANMIEAIFADVGVTIFAILNSLRILK